MNPIHMASTSSRSLLGRNLSFAFLILFAFFVLAYLGAPRGVAFAAGNISGNVFRDYNANGAKDTAAAGVAGDSGVSGVTVTAYNAAGTSVATATSDSSGNYSLDMSADVWTRVSTRHDWHNLAPPF